MVTVERGKPEKLVAADVPAYAEAPAALVIGRGIGLRREYGNCGAGGRSGLLHPLRKGVARSPSVLAVKQEGLAVQTVASTPGFKIHAPAGCRGALGVSAAGNGLHLADGRLGKGKTAPACPCLSHPVWFAQPCS